jgi:hypothetical protein
MMENEARSRRREREAAFLWIGWGSLYLVHAFVWAVRLEWPPPPGISFGVRSSCTGDGCGSGDPCLRVRTGWPEGSGSSS